MGCPDWPTCFGQWVPPTDVSQLPEDYQTRYAKPGFKVAEFNVFHTWTEYVNRIIGVLIGLFIAVTMVSSFQFRKSNPKITVYAVLSFILVGFQGWIGKVVVDKHLAGWMVTIHMILALVIVALVMLAVFRNDRLTSSMKNRSVLTNLSLIALVLTLIQIVSGTQVREWVDTAQEQGKDWVELSGSILTGHIILSYLIVGLSALYWFQGRKSLTQEPILMKVMNATMVFTFLQLVTGVLNRYVDFPAAAQMGHVLFGTMVAGGWFYLWMVLNRNTTRVTGINE